MGSALRNNTQSALQQVFPSCLCFPAPTLQNARVSNCVVTRKTVPKDLPSHQFCRGYKLPLLPPSGLLDLFLMCIYKEFTVGKGLGLPQSAI